MKKVNLFFAVWVLAIIILYIAGVFEVDSKADVIIPWVALFFSYLGDATEKNGV
ncbi:hypothetical protein D3C71_1480980 [compost metagenome]